MRLATSFLAFLPCLAFAGDSPSTAEGMFVDGDWAVADHYFDDVDWVSTELPKGIVNGETTTEFDNVLAFVAYFGSNQGFNFCSGTQISDDYVITAAHCAEAGEDYIAQGATLYWARTDNIYSTANDAWFEVADTGIEIHPQWPGNSSQEIINDVALTRTTSSSESPCSPSDCTRASSVVRRGSLRVVGFGHAITKPSRAGPGGGRRPPW